VQHADSIPIRKAALSFLIIALFLAYSFWVRHPDTDEGRVVAPAGMQSANNATSSTPVTTSPSTTPATTAGTFKDGTYTGVPADAFYGNVQVRATIQNGKLTSVKFLQYPSDRDTSQEINRQAMPFLQQEAIQAQSAQVDTITGATDTSQAFIQSLSSALEQAR